MTTPPPPTLEETLQQILINQQTFQQNLTNLTTEMAQIRNRLQPQGQIPDQPPHNPFTNTTIKLDIPRFDGSDPLGWIFKISQFFEFHHTPEDQRIRMASFYMEGEALTWYQWMHSNQQLLNWPMFVQALEMRFAPSQYEDLRGALFKLCQTGSVKEY
jgi:hypothetical protein